MPSSPSSGFILSKPLPESLASLASSLGSTARLRAWALLLAYGLSGLTALSYEVLWARMLTLQFGVSIFGVVISVTAFMAGLGLGSVISAKWARVTRFPLAIFAALEIGVALYALASPWLLSLLAHRMAELALAESSLAAWYLLQGSVALIVLLIPALALGAGFAFMLSALSSTTISLATLYGLNAWGGALGALLPLGLLPVLGWTSSMEVVAGIGLVVGGVMALLALLSDARPQFYPIPSSSRRPAWLHLLAYAGVGAAALMIEIAWIRLFGMILLRTEYVMAVILAVYVLGIGLGSLLARRASSKWLAPLPVLGGTFALLSLWWLPQLSAWVEQTHYGSLSDAILWQSFLLAALTLPVTLALGAWLPLLCARLGNPRLTAPWLYGVNSMGAALGALSASVLFIPWLGAHGTVCVAALLLVVCGMVWRDTARLWWALPVLLMIALPVRNLPSVAQLLPKAHAETRDLYRHEDAISITHVIERTNGQRVLLTDLQRMDAATDQTAVAIQENQARLPLLLHPAPRSVLFLGLGTGISAAGSLPFPGLSRTAVELSQGAITAARTWFASANRNILQEMAVVRDDARRYLSVTDRAYDVIIGDLFHPDLVGQGALLSVQQFARARACLAPGGLFVQWLALNQFDTESLAVVLRGFQRVFPGAVIFMDGFRLALVGPKDEFQGAPAMLANLRRLSNSAQHAATGGEGEWTWLGRYWGELDMGAGPVQDEWAPSIEFRLPRIRYQNELSLVVRGLLEHRPTMDEAARALRVSNRDKADFERGYIATELVVRGWLASLNNDDGAARLNRLAYEANPQDRWIGFALADSMLATLPQAQASGLDEREALTAILRIRPDHVDALRALWHLERGSGRADQAAIYRERLRKVLPLDKELRGVP